MKGVSTSCGPYLSILQQSSRVEIGILIVILFSGQVIHQQHFSSPFLLLTAFCCKVKPYIVVYNFFFLFRILATNWSNALRVLSKVLALVYTYTIPICSATFTAAPLSTCLISSRSILLPTSSRSILDTSVFSFTSLIQKLTISNDLMLEISNTSRMPSTFLQQLGVMVLQRVVPAVSQICTRIELPSYNFNVFCLYSTPIVVVWFILNSSSTYCVRRELLPTQLQPIMRSFTLTSYFPLIPIIYKPFHQTTIIQKICTIHPLIQNNPTQAKATRILHRSYRI